MLIDEHLMNKSEELLKELETSNTDSTRQNLSILVLLTNSNERRTYYKKTKERIKRLKVIGNTAKKEQKDFKNTVKKILKGKIIPKDVKQEIDKNNNTCKEIEVQSAKYVKEIKKKRFPVFLFRANAIITFVYCLLGAFLFGLVGFAKEQGLVLPCTSNTVLSLIGVFILWKVFYYIKYEGFIQAERNVKALIWLLYGGNALIIASVYLAISCLLQNWSSYIYAIALLISLVVKVVGQLYNLFMSVKIIKVTNETVWIVISVLILFSLFAGYVDSFILKFFAKIVLVAVCLILTTMVLKACLIDNQTFKNYASVANFIIIVFLTIGLSIFAIYKIFWQVEGGDQTLFSTIMGVYAAVLGGAITLGGVAWTIKKQDRDRKEEEKKKAKPLFSFRMLTTPLLTVNEQRVCFDDEGFLSFEKNVMGIIENSEKSAFSIEKVYHDNKWWNIVGNKVILPNKSVYFDFNFTKENWLFFLEVEDALQNKFYYKIDILTMDV